MIRSLLLFCFVVLIACTEEEVTARKYPRVYTRGITNISKDGMKLQGEIFFSSVPILDHGFVWSDTGFPTITNGTKLSLGPKNEVGTFAAEAIAALQSGKTYAARAYAQSSDFTVYGDICEFKAP
jgi:hypothetical protein